MRPYQFGDEHAICDLFEKSFGRSLPAAVWSWRYAANPAGGPWIELAWDGDELAAHYAMSPAILCIDGREVSAALSMTTMTHAGYRGRGLFPALAERLYRRFSDDRGALVYGFPNANSHRGFVRDLSWHDLYEIPTLRVLVAAARSIKEPPSAVKVVDALDHRADMLWSRLESRFPVWLRRDSRWLSWRFSANPVQKYKLVAWEDGDDIRGWAVSKRFGSACLDVVDLVAEDDAVTADLVSWTLAYAHQTQLAEVATWCPLRAPWRPALEACGFRIDAPVTYMGARALTSDGSRATVAQNWVYSMADSDVY